MKLIFCCNILLNLTNESHLCFHTPAKFLCWPTDDLAQCVAFNTIMTIRKFKS